MSAPESTVRDPLNHVLNRFRRIHSARVSVGPGGATRTAGSSSTRIGARSKSPGNVPLIVGLFVSPLD
jgi:hypothetical protein